MTFSAVTTSYKQRAKKVLAAMAKRYVPTKKK
jgi:hypothetical protein